MLLNRRGIKDITTVIAIAVLSWHLPLTAWIGAIKGVRKAFPGPTARTRNAAAIILTSRKSTPRKASFTNGHTAKSVLSKRAP